MAGRDEQVLRNTHFKGLGLLLIEVLGPLALRPLRSPLLAGGDDLLCGADGKTQLQVVSLHC
jgi:hypothetical protein